MHTATSILNGDAGGVPTGSPEVVARRTHSQGFAMTEPLQLPGRSSRRRGITTAAPSPSTDVPLSKQGPPVGQKKIAESRRLVIRSTLNLDMESDR